MRRGTWRVLSVLIVATLTAVVHGSATTITSTSLSSWEATLAGSPTDVDFSKLRYGSYDTAAGITLSGFTFIGPDNGSYKLTGQLYNGTVSLLGATDKGAGIGVAMPAGGETAFGVYFLSTGGTSLGLTLSDGESFTLSRGFFGVTLSQPVTSFFLSATPGSQAVVYDALWGTSALLQEGSNSPSATPEAGTILLFGVGFLVLGIAMRKRSAHAPCSQGE